jgi:hypothetical protein
MDQKKSIKIALVVIAIALVAGAGYFAGRKPKPATQITQPETNQQPSTGTPITPPDQNTNPTSTPPSATSTSSAEIIPAFTAADLKQGWYYGSKAQKKPGTPATWLHRYQGTRSSQWYNPSK